MELREQLARAIAKRGEWETSSWLAEAEDVLEVIRPIIEERDALRAEIEALKKQAPAAFLIPGTITRDKLLAAANGRNSTALYLATGAQPAPSVPDGWKLVPIEPTRDMLDRMDLGGNMLYRYRAMLAAAPKPENKE